MKRFFFKQLALVLALTMLLSSVGISEGSGFSAEEYSDAANTSIEDCFFEEDVIPATDSDPVPEEIGDMDLPSENESELDELPEVIPEEPQDDGTTTADSDAEAESPEAEPGIESEGPGAPSDHSDAESVITDDNTADNADSSETGNEAVEGTVSETGTEQTTITSEPKQNADTEKANKPAEDQNGEDTPASSEPSPASDTSTVTEAVAESESNQEIPAFEAASDLAPDLEMIEEPEQPKMMEASGIPGALSMGVKEKYQLTGGDGYTSTNPKAVTVSASGLITARKKGSSTITVTAGGNPIGTCQVTVKNAPKKITLPKKQSTVVGQSIILNASVKGGASATITWSSSNPSVATVDSTGLVTGVGMGKAKITARTYNKKKATCTVTVDSPNAPTSVGFPMGTLYVGKGESVQLKPEFNPGAESTFTYKSKSKSVASVGKNTGVVKGKKVKKSTKITVTTQNGKKAGLKVKVLKAPKSVAINIPGATLDVGGAVGLTATVSAKTASQITWTSSNPGVAAVSEAVPFSDGTNSSVTVTAVGGGSATITATTFNGRTASCEISVNAPAPAPAPAPEPEPEPEPQPQPELDNPSFILSSFTTVSQGEELVVDLANSSQSKGESYKAILYTGEEGNETIIQEIPWNSDSKTITIPTLNLSLGTYKLRISVSADGYTDKSVEAGEITVGESPELVMPSFALSSSTPKQDEPLIITINNADQGKNETYKAELYNDSDNICQEWNVDERKIVLNNLNPGFYSLRIVVSSGEDSKVTESIGIRIKPAILSDISCTLSMNNSMLPTGSTIPQGKAVQVTINHDNQDLGENYKVTLSGGENDIVFDTPDKSITINSTDLAVGVYTVTATVYATDYNSITSNAVSFTVAALSMPILTLNTDSVALGTPVEVTVSGDQPVEVEYMASIINLANENDRATGNWNGSVLIIDTTGLTAGATYKVSVTANEKGNEGYAAKTAETVFSIPGLEAPIATITRGIVKQGEAIEATITNLDGQPTAVTYASKLKPVAGDALDVVCALNGDVLSIITSYGTDDAPVIIPAGKYQLVIMISADGYQSVSTDVGEVLIKPLALAKVEYSLLLDDTALPTGNIIPYGESTLVIKIDNQDQAVGEQYQAKLYQTNAEGKEIWAKTYDWNEATRSIEISTSSDDGMLNPGTYQLSITVLADDYDSLTSDSESITVASEFQMEGGTIISYTGTATDVVIPAMNYDGVTKITAIGEKAFKDNATITSVSIPGTITEIRESAFENCTSLATITIANGTTTIKSKAFAYTGLQEVTLPRSLTSIADDVFEGCGEFAVNVPMNCYAYDWCVEKGYISKLKTTPAELFTYEAINGLYAKITGYTGTDVIVVIPEMIDDYTIQEIGENAFANNALIEKVVLPDSIISIDSQAFRNCSALKEVDLGNSVESLGYCAFYACTSLTEFYFPDSVTTLDQAVLANCSELSYVNYPRNWNSANRNGYVFAGCPKLTHIDVPEGVTIIPNFAFANCPNLKTVSLPEGLEYVYHHAFSNCTGLTSMVYPSTIKTVGGINGCTGITEVIIPDGAITIGTNAFDSVPIKTLIIPDSVEEILSYAFQNCESLETISFGNSLKTIGHYVFYNCTKIDALLLPDSVESIGGYAFANCSDLSEFHFPVNWSSITESNGTTYYGHNFDNCTKLKRIDIPEGATTIPRAAFQNATFLRDVTFPSTLKYIGADAFNNCTAITSLVFNEGIEIIGSSAFEGCNNLISAMLPDSVTDLYSKAFRNCSNLSSFHYPLNWQTVAPKSDINYNDGFIFEGCVSLTEITIPEGVVSIPTSAFNGATYLKMISLPSTLKTIGSCGLRGCIGLTDLSFPDGFYGLGNYSLENCTGISELNLPDSVTVIGGASFRGCTNLKSFHYPKNWTYTTYYKYDYYSIGHIFDNCPKLESIVMPEGVSVVPADAFADCKYLKEVYVPISVTKVTSGSLVGGGAFDDSPNLTIYYNKK